MRYRRQGKRLIRAIFRWQVKQGPAGFVGSGMHCQKVNEQRDTLGYVPNGVGFAYSVSLHSAPDAGVHRPSQVGIGFLDAMIAASLLPDLGRGGVGAEMGGLFTLWSDVLIAFLRRGGGWRHDHLKRRE